MVVQLLLMTSLLTLLASCDATLTLTLMHTNDVHSRYEQFNKYGSACSSQMAELGKCYGGYARLKTAVDEIRGQKNDTLLLDAGDQFQGSLYFYTHGGDITSDFMNWLKYDAMAVGIHEFDRGIEGLVPFLKKAEFHVVSANMGTEKEPSLHYLVKRSVVISRGGQDVGIVGYTTEDAPEMAQVGNATFSSVVTAVQQEVNLLRTKGVKVIIALGHAGFTVDQQVAQIPGVSVVIGGQTDTFLYTGDPPSNEVPAGPYPTVVTRADGTRSVVAQCFTWAKYLCVLHLTFSDSDGRLLSYSGNPQLLDSSVPQDHDTLKKLQPWKRAVKDRRTSVIGKTILDLNGHYRACWTKECNLGSLIADAMVKQNQRHPDHVKWSNIHIGLVNGGGIRASIPEGDITLGDVVSVLPYGNTIDVFKIKGKYLRKTFEFCASKIDPCKTKKDEMFGGFLQVSGLKVKYDLSRPVGDRVVSLKAKVTRGHNPVYKDVQDDKQYKMIVANYLARGGDGYTMLAGNAKQIYPIGNVDTDVLVEYVKRKSPLSQKADGRIQFVRDSDVCRSGAAGLLKGGSSVGTMVIGTAVLTLLVPTILSMMA